MGGLVFALRRFGEDLLSTLLFALLLAVTGNLALALCAAVVLGIVQLALEFRAGRGFPTMPAISLFLVAGFGAASLVAHDARIAMLKPSVVYAVVGAAMLKPGWMNRYLTPTARSLVGDVALVFGYAWAGLMFLTAVLNAWIAGTGDAATWAAFLAIFPLASKIGLFAVQYAVMRAIGRRRRTAAGGAAP